MKFLLFTDKKQSERNHEIPAQIWWRWGESNPRPTADPEVFSGRILLFISQPLTSCRPAASRLSRLSVGTDPPTWSAPSGLLNDARHQAGGTTWADGLKVHAAISGGENVVGAVLFGTYWFARSVSELSARSRPASPRSTTAVETDHPLLSSSTHRPSKRSDVTAYPPVSGKIKS